MDILEIVLENIEAKDNKSIRVLVNHFCKQGLQQKSRVLFSNCLINFFCKYYLNKNLWLLQEFTKHISEIEKNDNKNDKDKIIYHMKAVCFLLSAHEYKEKENILDKTIKDDSSIERILHTSQKEYVDLVEYKEILDEEIYILINVLYHNIAYGIYIHDCFSIIRYMILKSKKTDDIIDLLFTILLKYLDNNRVPSDVKSYVISCKDLFYYRLTKKVKNDRINLLVYALFVLVQKRVKYQVLDEYMIKEEAIIKDDRTDYLFVLTRYDHDTINIVNNDKMYSNKRERVIKNVNIKDQHNQEKYMMDIIKDSWAR